MTPPPRPSGRRPAISHGGALPTDPDHPRTLGEALRRAADRSPHAGIHVVAADGRTELVDYPTLLVRARTVRAGLAARGLAPGSYAILRITSGAQFWPAFWGCALAGVVPLVTAAPGSYEMDSPALAGLLHAWRALDAPIVIGGTDDVDGLRRLPLGERVVPVTDLAEPGEQDGERPGGRADSGARDDLADAAPETVALLQLSSGSTGTPKIIPLTHRGLSEYAVGARDMLDIRTDDVLLNWLPLDHSAGLLLYHVGGVFLGVTSVHVATERVLADPLRWLELVRHHGVTHTWAPNFGLRLVADAVARNPERRWDLPAVRRVVSGGEQCLPETFRAFVDATGIPASAMTPAWGMAETTTAITFAPDGLPACLHRVRTASLAGDLEFVDDGDPDGCSEFLSVGPPAPGAALRVVDRDDELLPEGRIGRLQVRSARITPGYLDDPEADRAAFADGGWLDTGDLAFMWDGRITITGREKDIIVLNGNNHPCHEIEQVAGAVDGVTAGLVAACGVPDPRTGSECLVVFYVPDPESDQPPHQVARAVTSVVSRRWHVAPAHVVAVPAGEFPRTSGGKIQRKALRERFVAGDLGPPASPDRDPTAATAPTSGPAGPATVRTAVFDAVADELDGPVDPARPFHELGVGSIGLIRIRARLEQVLGRPVPQPVLFAHPTVDALTRYLTASAAGPAGRETGSGSGRDRRIAVIGMAARFPGAATVDEYWANLLAGAESIRFFDRDELVAAGMPRETVEAPDFVAASGALDDIAGFDAGFFGITAREAELLDPQHRLFLEVCQHALEDAGYAGGQDGEHVGLFAGSGMNLYSHHTYLRNNLALAAGSTDPATVIGSALGNQPDFLATRVAYRLGLTGPAINVQTACSTSLVAVHLAVRALLDGDADVAIAGAAAVHVPQVTGYRHTPGSILSARGRCRPFDADADGTVGGNGVAAVVLKPLDRALADGDPVHAVILGSAVNNDGAGKVGFTAPGVAGQVEVVRRALRDAAVPAASIGYVEAHGTGTALGDPVEHHALAEAYATARPLLGSVKANIGHLDSCAGMAGLIKAVLTVRTGRIPPQINLTRPAADLADGPFTIATSAVDWPGVTPRRAAVSALGVGGTNAHVIVEQPPSRTVAVPAEARPGSPEPGLLPLSAADPAALTDLAVRYRDHLRRHPDLRRADLVLTTGRGRRQLRHRLVALGGSSSALASALDRWLAGGGAADVLVGDAGTAGPGPIALAFPGQGDLRTVVLDLAERFPVVRDVLDRAVAAHRRAVGGDLLAGLRDRPDAGAAPTDVAQPALVVTGVALAELWRSWGVTPDYVLGHSVGEYAALVTAGALSLADAVRLTAHRGRLMRDRVGPGAMVAVLAGRQVVDDLIAGTGLELAAVNGPGQHVVAGPPEEADALTARAGRLGVRTRRLPVSRAFHSAAVEPMLDEFRTLVGEVDIRPIRVPFVSTLDGRLREPGWRPDADYLCRQARATVDHHAAVLTLTGQGCRTVVEAGADGVLTGIAAAAESGAAWVPSQRRDLDPAAGLWRALADLHCAGVPVDWAAVAGDDAHRVSLPTYPFQHRTFWIDPPTVTDGEEGRRAAAEAGASDDVHPAPGTGGTAAADVLDRIRALVAEKLGVGVAEVDPDETFFGLGADSLLLITMSREIEQAFGVRVPVRDLFATVDTPRRLAEAVTAGAPSAGGTSPAAAPGSAPVRSAEPAAARSPQRAEPAPPGQPAVPVPRSAVPAVAASPSAVPAVPPDAVPRELTEVIHRQLDLMRQQLALLGAGAPPATAPAGPASPLVASATPAAPPVPAPGPAAPPVPAPGPAAPPVPAPGPASAPVAVDGTDTVDVSLYFFGDYPDQEHDDKYGVILDAAQFADEHGFHAVWLPERHFHSFGGIFPNPSVLAAALAVRTRRLRINAGSVVLPLHHPVRVAEEWSMVDNLSGGRVGLGCAPGWHANDFVFYPDNYGRHKQVMYEHLDTVRQLWRGESVPARSGSGEQIDVRLFPRPVQPTPPVFTAIVGNPDSYREAARRDVGVVTNLMTQDVAQLAENIALYRRTRAEHGLDPAGGRVTVLLHTYLGDDVERVRAAAFEPFCAYLRSSFSLLGQVVNSLGMNIDLAGTPDDDVRFVLSRAYERYCTQRALIGTPESCRPVIEAILDAGVDEIACFVDFGLPAQAVRDGLPFIDALRRATPRRGGAVDPPAPDEIAPLSPGQRRLWLIEQLHPGTPAYTEAAAVRLRGPLDVPALQGALRDVVDRHAPLRTVYREVDGQPCQVVRARVPVRLPVRDHAGQLEDDVVREVMAGESRRVFDLGEGPVFAFTLLRFSATHHVLVMTFHHLSTDGGSYAVLTREVSACYRARLAGAPAQLSPLPTTYPDLARARRDRDATGDKALRYWLTRLDPPPPTLVLPSDLPRPALPAAAGRSVFDEIPAELTARIRQLSRAERVTPFTTLLSAFGVVLFQYSGQPDLVVGTGSTGRDEATQDLVGFFINTLPLRLDLGGDPTFSELVARVQATAADGYDHADVPFDALVRALAPAREPGRHPLFDVVVEYETGGAFAFDLPDVTAEPLRVGLDKAPVDLMVYLSHGDTVTCHVEYRTEVFDPTTVRRILDRLHRVLDRVTRDPHVPLSRLVDQDATVLCGASVPLPDERLHELFTRQAARTPEAVAVVAGETRWTYRDLHDRADATARRIRAAGVGPDDVVAVLLPRRPELIAAQLGVLIAGAAFLPLDPELPPARVAALLADSGARLLVTTAGVDHPTGVPRLLIEEATPADLPPSAVAPTPDQLAWCVYTSGSTGAPKGVAVPHRAAVDTVAWHARALALTEADAVAHGLGLGFDANLAEIYPALAAGATIHLVPSQVRSDPARLRDWWAKSGITVAFLPAPLAELVFALPAPPAGTLRTLVVGGSQLRRRPPAGFPARVLNAYGPTENTIVTTAGPVAPDGAGPIDIGRPVDNRRVYVLDAQGRPVPPGAAGELHVAGGGLARGYLGRPADTSAAFVPDPFSPTPGAVMYRTGDRVRLRGDGTLEFLGRVDDQVKIAGHRVEPGEAGAALALLPGVRQAAVVARHDRGDEPYLAAYVVPEDDSESPADRAARLTCALAELLPAYLVPRAWVSLDALPTTGTGKIDTARLPAPAVDATGQEARTGTERLVHDAWCAELGVPRLPLDVPFFTAGGHSLAAVRLANRLTELLGTEVGVHRVLRAPGIRAMAATLAGDPAGAHRADPDGGVVAAGAADVHLAGGDDSADPGIDPGLTVEDRAPATYQQETMWHRQRVAPNPAAVHMAVRITLTGRLDVPALRAAIDGLVARHDALRTRVVDRDGTVVQEVLAHRAVPLPVETLEVADAPQIEAWCVAAGREPFPADGPRLRARLGRLAEDRWVLIMIVHHLSGDGWSMMQLLRELEEGYRSALAGRTPVLAAPALRYADHARRQRGAEVPESVLRYWRDQLAGAPRTVPLPADRPRPAALSGGGAEYAFDIPAAVTERLRGLADELGTSLFPVLASGYALLVARLTGVRDLVLACPYAHRDSRDTENVVGLFTSPLLLRPSLDARCFADLVARTDATFLDAVRHQPAPLPAVYAAVDPDWRPGMAPPVASTLFAWNPGIPSLRLPGVTTEVVDQGLDCARRDYTTVVTPVGDGLRGVVEYSTDLFDEATVAAWCAGFVDLLDTAAADPHEPGVVGP